MSKHTQLLEDLRSLFPNLKIMYNHYLFEEKLAVKNLSEVLLADQVLTLRLVMVGELISCA